MTREERSKPRKENETIFGLILNIKRNNHHIGYYGDILMKAFVYVCRGHLDLQGCCRFIVFIFILFRFFCVCMCVFWFASHCVLHISILDIILWSQAIVSFHIVVIIHLTICVFESSLQIRHATYNETKERKKQHTNSCIHFFLYFYSTLSYISVIKIYQIYKSLNKSINTLINLWKIHFIVFYQLYNMTDVLKQKKTKLK